MLREVEVALRLVGLQVENGRGRDETARTASDSFTQFAQLKSSAFHGSRPELLSLSRRRRYSEQIVQPVIVCRGHSFSSPIRKNRPSMIQSDIGCHDWKLYQKG